MAVPKQSIVETRRDQIFPRLDDAEVERLRRFGEERSYAAGEYVVRTGEVSPGLVVILSGEVGVSHREAFGPQLPIVTHARGSFLGELAQLSGHPALVDGQALTPVHALVISSERLHDVLVGEAELGERIMRALILRRVGLLEEGAGGPVIVGDPGNPDVLRLEGFLARNAHPHQLVDPAVDPQARTLVERFHVAAYELPIVVCPNGRMLRNPSERELARCMGLVRPIDPGKTYDAVIVGAGPAGLAAAVYAASEGLRVLVLDSRAFGGQAGASARIENYLGFPTGISGMALMGRAYSQARKFGAELAIPDDAAALHCVEGPAPFQVLLADEGPVNTRAVVLACGARYRQLAVPGFDELASSSVHYWATALEGRLCTGQDVALVGGGNSAGQAAVFLASHVSTLWLLVRGRDLESSMSRYLVQRIGALPNVRVLTETEVTALEGAAGVLQRVRCRNRSTGEELALSIRHLFLFIGADPNTEWLAQSDVALDAKGFVLTGNELGNGHALLQSSRPGVFAIGDVRSGSIKRVAAAVGEGAQVVAALHGYLAGLGTSAASQERRI